MSKTILSTKTLKPHQKELVLNSGLGLVSYDAIAIQFIPFTLDLNTDYFIITSKNSAKALLNYLNLNPHKKAAFSIPICCVGTKTSGYLTDNGFTIAHMAHYGKELATYITTNLKDKRFTFLAGNLRRNEIPELLAEAHVNLKEITCYHTITQPKLFERNFDGILLFSPSGVDSFTTKNSFDGAVAFCIGNTTATEAKKYTDKIIIANKPTVENVLVQAIKTLNYA